METYYKKVWEVQEQRQLINAARGSVEKGLREEAGETFQLSLEEQVAFHTPGTRLEKNAKTMSWANRHEERMWKLKCLGKVYRIFKKWHYFQERAT